MRFYLVKDETGTVVQKSAFQFDDEQGVYQIRTFILQKENWAAQEVSCDDYNKSTATEVQK